MYGTQDCALFDNTTTVECHFCCKYKGKYTDPCVADVRKQNTSNHLSLQYQAELDQSSIFRIAPSHSECARPPKTHPPSAISSQPTEQLVFVMEMDFQEEQALEGIFNRYQYLDPQERVYIRSVVEAWQRPKLQPAPRQCFGNVVLGVEVVDLWERRAARLSEMDLVR